MLSIFLRTEYTVEFRDVPIVPPSFAKLVMVVWEFVWVRTLYLVYDSPAYFHRPGHSRLKCSETSDRGVDTTGLPICSGFLGCGCVVQFHDDYGGVRRSSSFVKELVVMPFLIRLIILVSV